MPRKVVSLWAAGRVCPQATADWLEQSRGCGGLRQHGALGAGLGLVVPMPLGPCACRSESGTCYSSDTILYSATVVLSQLWMFTLTGLFCFFFPSVLEIEPRTSHTLSNLSLSYVPALFILRQVFLSCQPGFEPVVIFLPQSSE